MVGPKISTTGNPCIAGESTYPAVSCQAKTPHAGEVSLAPGLFDRLGDHRQVRATPTGAKRNPTFDAIRLSRGPLLTLPAHRYKDRPSLDAIPDGFAIEERGTPLARTLRRASRTAQEASSDHPGADVGDSASETRASATEDAPHVWAFDVDDTLTVAPQQFARLSQALRAIGDRVVIVTGHGPVAARQALLDAIGFVADDIVVVDPGEFGEGKAKALEDLGAWFLFDDKLQFGPEVIAVCPVTFQYIPPEGDVKPKKASMKAAKALGRA